MATYVQDFLLYFLRKKLIISPSLEYYLPILEFDIVIHILASYLTEI